MSVSLELKQLLAQVAQDAKELGQYRKQRDALDRLVTKAETKWLRSVEAVQSYRKRKPK